ncbi:MAG TPA: nuclear transport factor 2 family protein [Acidimicrobiales bacterium]|nr:nuclear transport factor 2 family protein [Acidimicrobiales bacterium]
MWALVARESIRDLVARYNANGDTGRFDEVVELFTPDAVMDVAGSGPKVGHDEIRSIFTTSRDGADFGDAPVYLRHMTATHQIDLLSPSEATGRCHYLVLTAVGLDHWGRYVDEYRATDGRWRFSKRRVTVDGRDPRSLFVREDG